METNENDINWRLINSILSFECDTKWFRKTLKANSEYFRVIWRLISEHGYYAKLDMSDCWSVTWWGWSISRSEYLAQLRHLTVLPFPSVSYAFSAGSLVRLKLFYRQHFTILNGLASVNAHKEPLIVLYYYSAPLTLTTSSFITLHLYCEVFTVVVQFFKVLE